LTAILVAAIQLDATVKRSVVPVYCTIDAEFWRTTLESTAVSDVAGKCEQKPMPT
jgi:hypothetical protein